MSELASRLRAGQGHRYPLVLLLVFVAVVLGLALPEATWARLVNGLVLGGSLLVVLWTSDARPALKRIGAVGVAVGAVGLVAAAVAGGDAGAAAIRLIGALYVALAPAAMAHGLWRQVMDEGAITVRTVAGVLAIYLMLGLFFAAAGSGLAAATDGPWFAQDPDPIYKDFLYFSFVTLTTTGYGDLTPVTGVGRALAVGEAILGQLYLVSVVAVIVSKVRARPTAKHGERGEGPGAAGGGQDASR